MYTSSCLSIVAESCTPSVGVNESSKRESVIPMSHNGSSERRNQAWCGKSTGQHPDWQVPVRWIRVMQTIIFQDARQIGWGGERMTGGSQSPNSLPYKGRVLPGCKGRTVLSNPGKSALRTQVAKVVTRGHGPPRFPEKTHPYFGVSE